MAQKECRGEGRGAGRKLRRRGLPGGAHPLKRSYCHIEQGRGKGTLLIIILILSKITCMERQHSLVLNLRAQTLKPAWPGFKS